MNILLTGGTGSFGNAFVNRILPSRPNRLVIYSRDEQKQEDMARRFGALGVDHHCLRFFIGDVRDRDRLDFAMRNIDTVVHAAALKIVPTAEYNPTECIATNITGTENVIRAAIRSDSVRRLLALSTDKAVQPINLYGASKLAAEKLVVAANNYYGGSNKVFAVMRYGNVIGSRGSVIPLFKAQIAAGKPMTVTDQRMTRFWITLQRAAQFTLDCLDNMKGREIFVPKLPSLNITGLAIAMGQNGKHPFLITGIRPGEKLHEILITEDDSRTTVDRDGYYVIYPHNYRIDRSETKVPDGFSYRSNTNKDFIQTAEIPAYLESIDG